MDVSPPGRDMIREPTQVPPPPSRVRTRKRKLDFPVEKLEPLFDAQEKLDKVKGSDFCGICLEELNEKKPLCMVVRCGHVFHCECIRGWISHTIINNPEPEHKCPTCRGIIQRLKVVQLSSFGKKLKRSLLNVVHNDIRYLQAI